MSIEQLDVGRFDLRVPGRHVEPTVSPGQLLKAIPDAEVERFRPLLPVGYRDVADAYARAAQELTVADLTNHYTSGLDYFHDTFVPELKQRLQILSGDAWELDDFVAFAAGSDVDLMTHVIEAVAARDKVALFPGDWYGFLVGSTHQRNIAWSRDGSASLACLCVPSVRNGHLTEEMLGFLANSPARLLNLNLYPTLSADERYETALALRPMLGQAMLSISFSRGFGLTASQLGVLLIHRDHPFHDRFETQWKWYTYYFNWLAAKTFLRLDPASLQAVDEQRRQWVFDWLREHDLPVTNSGSYYIKAFQVDGPIPDRLRPLARDGVVRLCFKPPQT